MLCELETDKVSVEVPSPGAGTLTEILAGEGETVQAGGKLALMSSGDGAATGPSSASDEAASAPPAAPTPARHRPGARTWKMPPPPREQWPRPG